MRRKAFFLKSSAFTLALLITPFVQPQSPSSGTMADGHEQHHHMLTTTKSGKTLVSGGVDGSVTPELIPDITAYRLFMNAVAEPTSATTDQMVRQRAKLNPASLSPDDAAQAFQVFASYQQQRKGSASAYQQASTAEMVQAYNTKRDEITLASMASLRTALSPDGMARLDAYVQRQKRHMTIAPFPKMP